jgi:hypothetical protein
VRTIAFIIILSFLQLSALSQVRERLNSAFGKVFFQETEENTFSLKSRFFSSDSTMRENPRLVAIILDITLGVLGMHRLYLGTDLKVPVFYALTLGGGGILWLIDLGMLIAVKDIEPFLDNPRLFMWAK